MLYFPKVSRATYFIGHFTRTPYQAHHGHSEGLSGHPFFAIKRRRQEANIRFALNVNDHLPIDKSSWKEMDNPILSPRGKRLVSRSGLPGQIAQRRLRQLVIPVCDPPMDGSHRPCPLQSGHHRRRGHHLTAGRGWKADQRNRRCHDWDWQVLPEIAYQNEISVGAIFGQTVHKAWYSKKVSTSWLREVCHPDTTNGSKQSHEHLLHLRALLIFVSNLQAGSKKLTLTSYHSCVITAKRIAK